LKGNSEEGEKKCARAGKRRQGIFSVETQKRGTSMKKGEKSSNAICGPETRRQIFKRGGKNEKKERANGITQKGSGTIAKWSRRQKTEAGPTDRLGKKPCAGCGTPLLIEKANEVVGVTPQMMVSGQSDRRYAALYAGPENTVSRNRLGKDRGKGKKTEGILGNMIITLRSAYWKGSPNQKSSVDEVLSRST